MRKLPVTLRLSLLPIGAACALAACGEAEEPAMEADATDLSGGELIVSDADAQGVDVTLPDTAMTPEPETDAPTMSPPVDGPAADDPAVDPATDPLP